MMDDDNERFRFLDRLAKSNCPLTEGEAAFIDKKLEEDDMALKEHERIKIDRMRERWEPELRARR